MVPGFPRLNYIKGNVMKSSEKDPDFILLDIRMTAKDTSERAEINTNIIKYGSLKTSTRNFYN